MSVLEDYTVKNSSSCKEAMKAIDRVDIKILFIVDDSSKLIATLTDGDIRRYLLSGGSIEDQAFLAGNKNPRVAANVVEAQRLYDKKSYIAIPIVKNGFLVDIFFGSDVQAKKKKIDSVPVIINAGGKGTRLDPFTKVLPKPLIPVGDFPIIEHIMREFGKYSLNKFDIIVNYKKELIKTYFNEIDTNYAITWHDELIPLGTGGGLSLLKGNLDSTFFFTNCDILITADYESLLRYHKENNNAITMVCAYKSITIPYGVIEMGPNGTINDMKEKPELSYLTNTGMYVVEPEVLDHIDNCTFVGFPDIVKKIQGLGMKVGVFPISEYEWMDMGQLDELEKMRVKLYGK